jgi:hypothetical protein
VILNRYSSEKEVVSFFNTWYGGRLAGKVFLSGADLCDLTKALQKEYGDVVGASVYRIMHPSAPGK